MDISFLAKCFPIFEKDLLKEIETHAIVKHFTAKDYIIKQGETIRSLPIVLNGNIKVFSEETEVQFLLYYISPGESCIFSFAHTYSSKPAEFSAIAELDTTLLLLPIDKVNQWLKQYPSFSSLLLSNYQKHYQDLLNTTKQMTCYNLDQRLIQYIRTKCEIEKSNLITISHQNIANDLGTSREVISRVMKKLSINKQVKQVGRKIKLL